MAGSSWHCRARRVAVAAAAIAAGLAASAAAGVSVGGEGGAWLRAAAGAEALAMGGAATATPACLYAWWNPAMLVNVKEPRLSLGMGIRSLGRTEGYLSGSFRIPPRVGMGMSLVYRGDPFINDLHEGSSEERLLGRGAFTALSLKTALGYLVSRKWSAGAAIGIYYQNMPTGYDEQSLELTHTSATGGNCGFDVGVRYQHGPRWSFALAARNMGASMSWQIASPYSLDVTIEDRPLPSVIAASRTDRSLQGRPFAWTCDVAGYLFDGRWRALERPEAVINNGFSWQRWEKVAVMAGIGDVTLSSRLTSDTRAYFDSFTFRMSLGLGADLSAIREGLSAGYAVTTDKVWAAVDQVLDIKYTF